MPFTPVMLAGLLLFVVPFAVATYRAVQRQRGLAIPVGLLSTASAVFLASRRPGNMVVLWFIVILVPVLAMLWLAEAAARHRSSTGHA